MSLAATLSQSARVLSPTAKRDVTFHLTPYAKGCEDAQASESKRVWTAFNRRPGQALFGLLNRLELNADQVKVSEGFGSISIHAPGDARHIYAFVWAGLSIEELSAAHEGLRQHLRLRGGR